MYGQQSGDEFQAHQAQVLTYSFSTNVHTSSVNSSSRPKRKIQQKLTLNIVQPLKIVKQNQADSPNSKFHKRSMYTNQGKIIRIGDAIFKSNFQCGSLGQVLQSKGQNTYIIRMDKQPNSNRSTAWFYFRCQGLKGEVNFIISGFTKSTSLYSQGMKICYRQIRKPQTQQQSVSHIQYHENNHVASNNNNINQIKKDSTTTKSDWHRGGTRINYSANFDPQTDETIFQLKFTYNFTKHYDEKQYPAVEFAYCYPYQFKRVNLLARGMMKKGEAMLESLGRSYQGRQIPLLTIGNQNAQKSIVLSARVHPGETVASFIMQGFLKQLTSQSEFAKSLREKYLFKIVPMINPDGVVKGNYRFSGAGYDLNRRWKHCYQSSHPEIHYLKTMIKKLHKQKKVLMYIDIHGHSRKKSAFFYGCCPANRDYLNNNTQIDNQQQQNMSKPKQFPFLMSKLNPNFKYDYCTFNMSKDKQGTARIQMWKQLHIDHVYTLESSFCSSADGGGNYCQDDFLGMGRSLLEGISVYFYQKQHQLQQQQQNVNSARLTTMCESGQAQSISLQSGKQKNQNNTTTINNQNNNISSNIFSKFINILNQAKQQLKANPKLLNIGMAGQDSGSDSQPQAGVIPEQQREVKSTKLDLYKKQRNQQQLINRSKQPISYLKQQQQQRNDRSIKITVRQQQQQQYQNISQQLYNNNNRSKRNRLTPEQLKYLVDQKLQILKNQQQQKKTIQKQIISMTVNNFYTHNSQQLDSLTTESLMKKNNRVHSINNNQSNNTKSMLQKLKNQRLNSQNPISNNGFELDNKQDDCEFDDKKRLQIMTRNLLKTRQGVQYRRVKKIAEQMKKKHSSSVTAPAYDQPPMPMVRGIVTVNNELHLSKRRIKSIAPSFYPQSQQQKNRRFSVQMAYRNNSFRSGKIPVEIANKRLVINGDDINVHCKGMRIYM